MAIRVWAIWSLAFLAGLVGAQHPGRVPDKHPPLQTWQCTKKGGCVSKDTFVVLDALSHPVYQINDPSYNCGNWGQAANSTACPDLETCQANCWMEGIQNYTAYGVQTEGAILDLHQIVDGWVASPRVYLLTPERDRYEMVKFAGGEFTFDVDMTKLPCGMNAAVCFMEMAEDGGESAEPLNTAGPNWGTGYCDAQCFTTPFIDGVGNLDGAGACCNEMDIWEANKMATCVTPHVCDTPGLFACTGAQCTFNGSCDEWGCQFNTYRNGDKTFYGPGSQFTINTLKTFTVVTQFPVDEAGVMHEIIRFYIQDGKIIYPPKANVTGVPNINYQDDEFCHAEDQNRFVALGGMKSMGEAIARGMVLVFSVWWDTSGFMEWLDYGTRGPCNATEGNPAIIPLIEPDPMVRYSNIKWGELNSTFNCKE